MPLDFAVLNNSIKEDNLEQFRQIIWENQDEVIDTFLRDIYRHAVQYGALKIVKYLLEEESYGINFKDQNEYALGWAAQSGHLEMVNYLLSRPEIDPSRDHQALALAREQGHTAIVEVILRWSNANPVEEMKSFDEPLENQGIVNDWQSIHEPYEVENTLLSDLYATDGAAFDGVEYVSVESSGLDFNAQEENVLRGDPDIREQLFEQLCDAAKENNLELLKKIIRDRQDEVNNALLSDVYVYAAEDGALDVVKYLLEDDSFDLNFNAQDEHALRWAARNGHREMVEYLLSHAGVNPPAFNYQALQWAWAESHWEIADAIVRWANANGTEEERELLNQVLKNPWILNTDLSIRERLFELLKHVAKEDNLEQLKQIIQERQDEIDNALLSDVYVYAAKHGALNVVKYLLENESFDLNFNAQDGHALRWAARNGHLEMVEYLLSHSDVNPGMYQYEALQWAWEQGHMQIVDAIVRWVNENEGGDDVLDDVLEDLGVVNGRQSIHEASVHKSVSESAIRLMQRYRDSIEGDKLQTVLSNLVTYVNGLPSTEGITNINGAAKRYLNELRNASESSRFKFIDRVSGVSTEQILALTFLGAQDLNSHPSVPVEEALAHVVRGLYEVQRGYNINIQNTDNGKPDDMICPAGGFNKPVEVLAFIHSDCEVYLISSAQAAAKLPKVVAEEFYNYLEDKLNEAKTKEALESFVEIVKLAANEGVEPFLPFIKNKILDRMFDEFGSAYGDNKEDLDFVELIESSEYVALEKNKTNEFLIKANNALQRFIREINGMNESNAATSRSAVLFNDVSERTPGSRKRPREEPDDKSDGPSFSR